MLILKNLLSLIQFGTNIIINRFTDRNIYNGDVADLKENILLMNNQVQEISVQDTHIIIKTDWENWLKTSFSFLSKSKWY